MRPKAYSYLVMKIKKQKNKTKIKRKLIFEDFDHCLDATQLGSKINQLDKTNLILDSLEKTEKKSLKNNRLILKSPQKLKNIMYLLKELTRLH